MDCVDTDSGGAGVRAQRGAVRAHERESTEHRRHQTRNVETRRIRFRRLVQPRPTTLLGTTSC